VLQTNTLLSENKHLEYVIHSQLEQLEKVKEEYNYTYTFLTLYFKANLEKKYNRLAIKTKNATLNNIEELFQEQNEKIQLLRDKISEMSDKQYSLSKKNISDRFFYINEIIAEYKQAQRIEKNKESEDDSEKGDSTDSKNDTSKNFKGQ